MPTRTLLICAALALGVPAARAADPTKEERIRDALRDVKAGPDAAREKAAHALWHTIYYGGFGTVPVADVLAGLTAATDDPSESVRRFAADALTSVKHEAAIPALIKLLGHQDRVMPMYACNGLARHGAKAKAAVPILIAGVNADRFGEAGLTALAATAGKDAVPVILLAIERDKLGPGAGPVAAHALAGFADPRAGAFMARMLDGDHPDAPVPAAMYFAELGNPPAVLRLRECLRRVPADDGRGPLSTTFSTAASVRAIAVEALGKRKDAASFAPILKMLDADPSVRVRTAAAVALGEYADARAVPALVKALGQKDEGHDLNVQGHTDGELRTAAVRSLGQVGTPDAFAALVDGLRGGPAKRQCADFWSRTKDPKHLAAFVKEHDKKPVDGDLAAQLIGTMLYATAGEPKLKPDEQTKAEAAFRAAVADPARFGPAADLSDKGKYAVRTTFTFYPGDFARVDFVFASPGVGPRDGHGHGVVYRKVGGVWKPVGRDGGWVS